MKKELEKLTDKEEETLTLLWEYGPIDGFPTSKESSSFTTVSDLMGFKGDTDIKGVEYKYDAEFTGDPLLHHANQGLILRFAKQ